MRAIWKGPGAKTACGLWRTSHLPGDSHTHTSHDFSLLVMYGLRPSAQLIFRQQFTVWRGLKPVSAERRSMLFKVMQGKPRWQMLTELSEKENRLSTAAETLHSQPWVALAKQGWFLIKNFNYNSVIENRKEHIGPYLIQNSQTTASMAYSHFSGGDHALDPVQ